MEDNKKNMKQETLENMLFLLIIRKVEKFRRSYNLNKTLSWKYGVINLVEISARLSKRGIITVEKDGYENLYSMTSSGLIYYADKSSIFEEKVQKEFKDELEFTQILLNKNDLEYVEGIKEILVDNKKKEKG